MTPLHQNQNDMGPILGVRLKCPKNDFRVPPNFRPRENFVGAFEEATRFFVGGPTTARGRMKVVSFDAARNS